MMSRQEFKSVQEMSAFLTHHINTPLTYIKANLELMESDIYAVEDNELKNNLDKSYQKMMQGIKKIEDVVNTVHLLN